MINQDLSTAYCFATIWLQQRAMLAALSVRLYANDNGV